MKSQRWKKLEVPNFVCKETRNQEVGTGPERLKYSLWLTRGSVMELRPAVLNSEAGCWRINRIYWAQGLGKGFHYQKAQPKAQTGECMQGNALDLISGGGQQLCAPTSKPALVLGLHGFLLSSAVGGMLLPPALPLFRNNSIQVR